MGDWSFATGVIAFLQAPGWVHLKRIAVKGKQKSVPRAQENLCAYRDAFPSQQKLRGRRRHVEPAKLRTQVYANRFASQIGILGI